MTGLRRFAIYVGVWTAVGLFFFSQDVSRALYWHDPTPWWRTLAAWLTGVWTAACLTPVVVRLGARFPIDRKTWPRRVPLHVAFSVAFSTIELVVVAAVVPALGFAGLPVRSFREALPLVAVLGFHGNVVSYWAICGIQHAIRHYRRLKERETQLVKAQLDALKGQLQPHFLFNTLNAIMVLVQKGRGRQAEDMLARLGDLLRCVLEDVDAQEVPLRRELEYVRLYLAIEQVRFADRMRVDIAADPALLDAAVPHMALQPIVENAVRHGIGQRAAAGQIRIRAARADGKLALEVRDDGPGLPAAGAGEGHGIGLANTRARLAQLYGDDASLAVENGDLGGAVATMILPYHVAEDAVHAVVDAHR